MKVFEKHKKRVEKVKEFTGKNMIFVITAIIAIIFLCYNLFFNPNTKHEESNRSIVAEAETNSETEETAAERESWRFYFVDLFIMVGGGGVCLAMILRERKRTKEDLK